MYSLLKVHGKLPVSLCAILLSLPSVLLLWQLKTTIWMAQKFQLARMRRNEQFGQQQML